MNDVERNKQIVKDFYETGFGGNPRKAVADHLGATYVQHNPLAVDGPDGFVSIVEWLRGANPGLRLEIKRMVAEGDMVVTHSNLVLKDGEPGKAVADFYRLEDGKIVEHWDVIQDVPSESRNENTMF